MAEVGFFAAAILAIAGAIGVVTLRSAFYNVLALVVHLVSLALLFLLLRAEFVAAAQIVVYAGAVMVLYVFVVAYVGGQDEPLGSATGGASRGLAILFAAALLVELCIAILGSGLKAIDSAGAGYAPARDALGTPAAIGQLLLTKFLFPFEAASILLLVAAVGAVVLARRRGGIMIDDARIPFLTALRPPGTGTMAEAASGRLGPEAPVLPSGETAPTREREPSEVGGW